jgi:transcriptional regulator with XRE-family HTH domain
MPTFGDRLKALRASAGWSQAELAEHSGVPIGTIRDYEQNRRDPLLLTAAKLASALKQPLEAFLDVIPSSAEPDAGKATKKGKRK